MSSEKDILIADKIALVITQRCALNCKLCCNSMPLYFNPSDIDKDRVKKDLKSIFEMFMKVKWLQFVGGEIFLHPDFAEILMETMKYKNRFEKVNLMTSGAVRPKVEVLEALQCFGDKCLVQVSNYGKLSYCLAECLNLFKEYGIPYQVKDYYGDIQYYGGWVDNTSMEYRGYDDNEIQLVFSNCWQIKMSNWHIMNGKLHNCIRSLFATDLGYMPKQEGKEADYVDFDDETLTMEEKRDIVRRFDSKPIKSCQYCSGFDSKNAIRYPAAEQVR